ncbi:MAG: hypothetical protein J0L53_07290 [Spirochaetes bacterium]|nr:hypothetical protein [Spirochaetota bacterium]
MRPLAQPLITSVQRGAPSSHIFTSVGRGAARWSLVFVFLLFLTPLHAESDWPISKLRLIRTQWNSWITRFFAMDDENNLIYGRVVDQGNKLQKILRFRRNPDLVKHFPMEDGDLVVSVYNPEKIMQFVAMDFTGVVRYQNEFALGYNVYDVDARVNIQFGNPSCLFYAYDRKTYAVKYWSEQRTQDIMVSREPIELMFLQWADGGIHYVSSAPSGLTWTFWKNGDYRNYPIPFPIKHARYYNYRNTMHLIGIDHEGGLWQFDVSSGELRKNLLERDPRLSYVERVIPLNFNKELNIVLTGDHISSAYRLVYDDFPRPRKKPRLEERKLFWPGRIYPLIDNTNQLNFLLETDLRHIFLETWSAPTAIITDIDWRLDIKRNPPVMIVNWSRPKGSEYAYRYLLNQDPDSEPLAEAKLIPSDTLQFSARKEGAYALHLQVRNVRTGSLSRVYHIPLVWQYQPAEPEVILQNQIAPRMIRPGRADFLLQNLQPGEYYAEVDGKPDTVPKKKIKVSTGGFGFKTGAGAAKYYLHIANRDPRSRVLSPVGHYLFFASPFDVEEDQMLAESYRRIEEIKRIRRKIEAAKGDPAATQLWINRLQEIEAQLK